MKSKGEKTVTVEVRKNCLLKGERIIVTARVKDKDGNVTKETKPKKLELPENQAAALIRAGKAVKVEEKAA